MKDVMIDIETMGTDPNKSPVLSIGCVVFNPQTLQLGAEFQIVLSLPEQLDKKRKIDADTLSWWMKQSDSAKKLFGRESVPVKEGLNSFLHFLETNCVGSPVPWGNGSTFDVCFLESILKENKLKVPWKFFEIMDLRTFVRFVGKGKKVTKIGVNHDALDDARSQAQYVIDVLKKTNNEK